MKVGLIVGHKDSSPGACNDTFNLCEYHFNDQIAVDVYDKMKNVNSNIHLVIIRRQTYKGLPEDVNRYDPAFAISLHCNAFNKQANGTETLYYHTSEKGKKLAEAVQSELLKAYGFPDRGILPRTAEDRGGYLLRYTNMPTVIAEPFFIDNDDALKKVLDNREKLIDAYVNSIDWMFNYLS